jgi:hypothetical protein
VAPRHCLQGLLDTGKCTEERIEACFDHGTYKGICECSYQVISILVYYYTSLSRSTAATRLFYH